MFNVTSCTVSCVIPATELKLFVQNCVKNLSFDAQGALVGSVSGMLLVTWINVGRITHNVQYPSLPLTSVDRCPDNAANFTEPWQTPNVTTDWTTATTATHPDELTPVRINSLNIRTRELRYNSG